MSFFSFNQTHLLRLFLFHVFFFSCHFMSVWEIGADPDGGHIRYSISGPVFSVDRDTGVVRLRQELDREKQDTIEVIISITGEFA